MNTLEVTTPTETQIVMTRAFDAPRALVFDAFTKPEILKRWLLGPDGWSMPDCEIDLRPGGTFRYVWRSDEDGTEFGLHGTFKEIDKPDRILHVEAFDNPEMGGEVEVTTLFAEKNGATTVTMTIETGAKEARDAAIASGMTGGVEQSYDRLAKILVEV